jgi:hypothetical protein
MSEARLLVAQGPSQLISALAVWEFVASQPGAEAKHWEDVLVLGCFCAQGKTAQELDTVCRQIAQSWDFQRIVSTMEHDAALENGQLSFEAYQEAITREIGAAGVGELYVCRNMQFLNEAALFAWPTARKVCYGDLGMIDLNSTLWCKPTTRRGYPQVDEIMTHAAVEVTPGAFEDFPLTRIPTRHLCNALGRASTAIVGLEASCHELLKDARARTVVACLSNLTESRTVDSLEKELLLYESCLETYVAKDTTILIKGHPRATQSQSKLLTDRLRSRGCDARSFTGLNAVPLDLFAGALKVDLVVPLFSHSGVLWRLQQPDTDILMGVPRSLMDRFFAEKIRASSRWDHSTAINYLLTLMATQQDFKPVRMSTVRRHSSLVPPPPILLPGRARQDENWLGADSAAARFYHAVVDSDAQSGPNPFLKWARKLRRRITNKA